MVGAEMSKTDEPEKQRRGKKLGRAKVRLEGAPALLGAGY
jgi:hypothetical protein